jgi:hypothetical protein
MILRQKEGFEMAKSDKLFVTDAECAERIGLTTDQFTIVLPAATQAGFPSKDPLFADRRYWPAVRAWLDRRYGLYGIDLHGSYPPDGIEPWKRKGLTASPGLDGKENWD